MREEVVVEFVNGGSGSHDMAVGGGRIGGNEITAIAEASPVVGVNNDQVVGIARMNLCQFR